MLQKFMPSILAQPVFVFCFLGGKNDASTMGMEPAVTADSGSTWHTKNGCNSHSIRDLLCHSDAVTAVSLLLCFATNLLASPRLNSYA
jgi:hypothetical protein